LRFWSAEVQSVRLTLISASPRRRELLQTLGVSFDVEPSDAVEFWNAKSPESLAKRNACRKIERSSLYGDRSRILIGADTIVAAEGRVFGKPIGVVSAERMLRFLSNRWHLVITGICLSGPASDIEESLIQVESASTSRVRFNELSSFQIAEYIQTGEWQGKAGGYAIQGDGGKLVAAYEGDYENIVGLPVTLLQELLSGNFSHCRFL
jgi:septum formation protein